MVDEDAIIKRIVKTYLDFQGEASTNMIIQYIEHTGFGLRKPITSSGLSKKLRIWSHTGKSGSWFRVTFETRNNQRWWRLK